MLQVKVCKSFLVEDHISVSMLPINIKVLKTENKVIFIMSLVCLGQEEFGGWAERNKWLILFLKRKGFLSPLQIAIMHRLEPLFGWNQGRLEMTNLLQFRIIIYLHYPLVPTLVFLMDNWFHLCNLQQEGQDKGRRLLTSRFWLYFGDSLQKNLSVEWPK